MANVFFTFIHTITQNIKVNIQQSINASFKKGLVFKVLLLFLISVFCSAALIMYRCIPLDFCSRERLKQIIAMFLFIPGIR